MTAEITEADLCDGPEAAAEKRAKAWAAMCKWIKMRCARKRGVNIPNVFRLFFEVAVADAGSKLRRPVFVLSERFCDNYAVQQLYPPEGTLPAVVNGDDLNFYELAIQYSENLSKDECFVALREMLFKLGEAAGQGHDLRVDFGAGHLVSHGPKVLSFDFAPMFGGAPPRPPKQKSACNDPMLNPKGSAAPSLLLSGMGAAAAAGAHGGTSPGAASPVPVGGEAGAHRGGARSPVGSSCLDSGGAAGSHLGGGAALSQDEEARLFAEVDRLDPEERAAAAEAAFADWRGEDLAPATKRQIGRVLALPEAQLAKASLEEVGAALGARAEALERQLEQAQQQTLAVEAKLREGNQLAAAAKLREGSQLAAAAKLREGSQLAAAAGVSKPPAHTRSPAPGSALQPAGSALSARSSAKKDVSARSSASARRTPPLRPQSAQGAAATAAAAAAAARQALGPMTALQGGGLGWGPSAIQPRAENPDLARGRQPAGSSLSASAPRPRHGGPALSIGFGAEGSAPVAAAPAAAAPAAPPPRKGTPGLPMGRYVPAVTVPASSTGFSLQGGRRKPSSHVATAPPLGPFRPKMPEPQDAANTAWRLYAAPEAPVPAKGPKAAPPAHPKVAPARQVGGLAPPHLPVA